MALPCDGWWWQERQFWDSKEPEPWDLAKVVYDLVDGLVPAQCLTGCNAAKKGWFCAEAHCALGHISVDYRREWIEETYTSHKGHAKETRLDETVTAELSATATSWSRIHLDGARVGFDALDVDASWDGRIDVSLPDDGAFHYEGSQTSNDYTSSSSHSWISPGCDVSVRQHTSGWTEYNLTLTTPDSTLEVEVGDELGCPPTHAMLDGDMYEIEAQGWNIVGRDGDGDGSSVAGGDCDDADPLINPCEDGCG